MAFTNTTVIYFHKLIDSLPLNAVAAHVCLNLIPVYHCNRLFQVYIFQHRFYSTAITVTSSIIVKTPLDFLSFSSTYRSPSISALTIMSASLDAATTSSGTITLLPKMASQTNYFPVTASAFRLTPWFKVSRTSFFTITSVVFSVTDTDTATFFHYCISNITDTSFRSDNNVKPTSNSVISNRPSSYVLQTTHLRIKAIRPPSTWWLTTACTNSYACSHILFICSLHSWIFTSSKWYCNASRSFACTIFYIASCNCSTWEARNGLSRSIPSRTADSILPSMYFVRFLTPTLWHSYIYGRGILLLFAAIVALQPIK